MQVGNFFQQNNYHDTSALADTAQFLILDRV